MKNRLKVLRAERDWTQAELAERLEGTGVTSNMLHPGAVRYYQEAGVTLPEGSH